VAGHLADITDVVRGVLGNPDIALSPATRFDDLPGWDSLHCVAVVVGAEYRFGLAFNAEETEALESVGDLLRAITAKQAA
jgi:acyl carrier protein